MLDLSKLDLEEIAAALADQTDYEHRWLINPQTCEIAFWTADGGIDGHTPIDLDDLDRPEFGPLPSYIWYQDMADFAEDISDDRVRRRLGRAIQGKGASAGSKTNCIRNTPTSSPRGMGSAIPAPGAGPSNGSPTTPSSTTKPPHNS